MRGRKRHGGRRANRGTPGLSRRARRALRIAIGRAAVLAAQHVTALVKAIWPADMVDAAAARNGERVAP